MLIISSVLNRYIGNPPSEYQGSVFVCNSVCDVTKYFYEYVQCNYMYMWCKETHWDQNIKIIWILNYM